MCETKRQMRESGVDWVGLMPQNWDVCRVKNLATEPESLFLDGDWINSDIIVSSGIRYLTSGNVGPGRFKRQGEGYVSSATFQALHCLKAIPGDLMICRLNEPLGRACIIPDDEPYYVVAVDNVILRPDKTFNKRFIMYAMNTDGYAHEALMAAAGATMKRISRTELGNLKIAYPPLAEQQRIVSFLDRECEKIDALKTKIETQIAKLEELRKCMISEVVTNGLKYKGKRNCCQAEVGSLPPGWSVNRLKYLADIQTGPFGTQLSASEYVDEGVPCINVKNIGDGVVKIDNIDKVPASVLERLPAHVLKTGDLVFGRKGSVDRHAVIRETNNGWLQGSDCIRVRIKGMDTDFASFYLRSNVVSDFLLKLAKGSTMPSMNAETIGIICMRIPPIEEQHKIAAYLKGKCAAVDIAICNFSNQLDKLSEYRKSLIYEYVTGKKEVA